MKSTFLSLSILLLCAVTAVAQKAETKTTGEATSQTSAATKNVNLDAGTQVAGELQNSIDVRKAKVGDQVILKTTKAIKSGGHTLVGKGAKLMGHVTEVTQKAKGNGESRIGLLFDRLEHGTLAMPIAATITSITSARASARANPDDGFVDMGSSSSARSTTSTSSSGSSGGLLGGVSNTVGNVVGTTTSAVGTTVNASTNAVGNTTTNVGRSLGRIQISQSSATSVEGGSTLTLQGDNLRLEKGTNINLVLTQSASAGTGKTQ